jgi:hypothetical protein
VAPWRIAVRRRSFRRRKWQCRSFLTPFFSRCGTEKNRECDLRGNLGKRGNVPEKPGDAQWQVCQRNVAILKNARFTDHTEERNSSLQPNCKLQNEKCKLVGRENSVRFAVREAPNSHEFGYVEIARLRRLICLT